MHPKSTSRSSPSALWTVTRVSRCRGPCLVSTWMERVSLTTIDCAIFEFGKSISQLLSTPVWLTLKPSRTMRFDNNGRQLQNVSVSKKPPLSVSLSSPYGSYPGGRPQVSMESEPKCGKVTLRPTGSISLHYFSRPPPGDICPSNIVVDILFRSTKIVAPHHSQRASVGFCFRIQQRRFLPKHGAGT